MGRPPCCDKSNVKRGLWTPEEDAKILAYVSNHGTGNWTLVPKKAGLNRCGKSCRLRWTNYLRPDLKHDGFTPEEEELIINLHGAIGSRWSLIARRLPGRTDNDVKNYWNTKLRKKLMKMGIDPVTHKPVSQVLSDLGTVSGVLCAGNQTGFINNDLMNNMVPTRTEPYAGINQNQTLEHTQGNQVQSWEFQVINSENFQPHVSSEAASSTSSSSSSNFTQLSSPQSYPPSSFDWSEFLHTDPSMLSEFQECDVQRVMSSLNLNPSDLMQTETGLYNDAKQGGASEGSGVVACDARKHGEGDLSTGESFVDGILDRDSEIRAAFPEILDSSFDY